ncbi:MAG TPA: 3'-5' exonuclease [Burkholderiaceae bacterium]|nr:3'-5' exonuclease [Burkholderiaceae bacterium]
MSAPVLVFDIETIPDVAGLRAMRGADASLSDAAVVAEDRAERLAAGRSEMLPLYLQRVLVISCVFRSAKGVTVQSFAAGDAKDEGSVIQTFFDKIEKHQPQLVSWNGGGFDLPVLHYRGLKHGVVADKYWDLGEDDREYKWNNYISRYHMRHLDLMDLLALYQPRANAPLDAMAKLCGLPGKLGMDGAQVWPAFLDGKLEDIRRYCETDVMNTWLLYCRFQKMRGGFTEAEHEREVALAREAIGRQGEPHWAEYLQAWS